MTALKGDTNTMNILGLKFLCGDGTKKNMDEIVKNIDDDDRNGIRNYAYMIQNGYIFPIDKELS